MASKTPTGKKTVAKVDLAAVPPAITAPGDVPAFVPTQAGTPKPAAAPQPPFVAIEAPAAATPAIDPLPASPPAASLIPAQAPAPVAKKKAVTAPPVAEKLEETVEPSVATTEAIMKEPTMDATTTAPFDNANTNTNDMADKAKTMFADASAKGTKAIAEMNDFGKGNIEAIVESSKIAARGIEAMSQEAAEFSRRQIEGATAAFKSMSAVKSPTDFFKLQSDFVRSSLDQLVAQTSKNTEAMLKLAGEVAQPVSNRVAIAAEKVKIAA
ncbi:phasin family protein [Sphingomonas endolithica]|uniref:phasin family protein n=1 Tax=Sphingomonas endolithica TaxID=2972485 RepID=UPI0021B05FC4|nr:TIGR01841 family phasin [Sphingomonas sp. ZFBP2030]